jgi:hypothetical protein
VLFYDKEAVERGLADSKAGWTKDVKEVRVRYSLPESKSWTNTAEGHLDAIASLDTDIEGMWQQL